MKPELLCEKGDLVRLPELPSASGPLAPKQTFWDADGACNNKYLNVTSVTSMHYNAVV